MLLSSCSLQTRIDSIPCNDSWGVETVHLLLQESHDLGCSDLHLLSFRWGILARGRKDGGLIDLARIGRDRCQMLIARLKVLSRLPAYVRQEPQDGRIEWQIESDSLQHLRISFLPTIHGENVVVRFPEKGSRPAELATLGMSEEILNATRQLLLRREGTVLLTGPSGSGKTTTLYAMMQHLFDQDGDRLNFLTIEDPVECDLGFAGQVQVNEAQGLSFERALRAAVRQDPNVLLIGEIRDSETARIAIQAGMTGHLVLSTIHAGRVARVFTRLLSIGIEPYLIASALTGALAQRLLRELCPQCRKTDPQSGAHIASGCDHCNGTGYRGRRGVFELAIVDESLREAVLARSTPEAIAARVAEKQRGNLVQEGRRLVSDGLISRAEFDFTFAGEES
ncbi:GspE/PulE family protein [bacterium]|nr:GspE/PulE family protein [bacterium]